MDGTRITAPLDSKTIALLHAGDIVLINGILLGARDAAHARLAYALIHGESIPVQLENQVIYYVGPAPAKPGHVIGPAGPTTSGRMDPYTPILLEHGVKGFIGKGYRSVEVKGALIRNQAVYMATIGGAAALLARQIKSCRVIAYPDLGTEAVHEFIVEDFPAIVINDVYGEDAYINGRTVYEVQKT